MKNSKFNFAGGIQRPPLPSDPTERYQVLVETGVIQPLRAPTVHEKKSAYEREELKKCKSSQSLKGEKVIYNHSNRKVGRFTVYLKNTATEHRNKFKTTYTWNETLVEDIPFLLNSLRTFTINKMFYCSKPYHK